MQQFGQNGKKYNIIVAPTIDSITASTTGVSTQGMILTIKGMGFSKIKSQNVVKVMDHQCLITSATFFKITCKMPAIAAPTDASYIGGRGLKRMFWNNTNRGFDDLLANKTPTTVETTYDSQGPKDLGYAFYHQREQRFKVNSFPYKDIWRGLFKAPSTGNYKFMISGDDVSTFYLDTETPWSSSVTQYTPTERAKCSYAVNFQEFYRMDSQISSDIALEADKYYYMEIKHSEGSGGDHVTLGVQVPNNEDFWPENFVYGIQQVKLVTNYTPE